jgi:hypothetical protein
MDWRHMSEILAASRAASLDLLNLCVWAKTNGGMGSLYRSRHELVFVFKSGNGPHINNIQLSPHGEAHRATCVHCAALRQIQPEGLEPLCRRLQGVHERYDHDLHHLVQTEGRQLILIGQSS